MEEERPKLEVLILHEQEIVTYPKIGEKAHTTVLTYRYGELAPRTLFIPKEEDTPEKRAALIRQDIDKALAFKPKIIKV